MTRPMSGNQSTEASPMPQAPPSGWRNSHAVPSSPFVACSLAIQGIYASGSSFPESSTSWTSADDLFSEELLPKIVILFEPLGPLLSFLLSLHVWTFCRTISTILREKWAVTSADGNSFLFLSSPPSFRFCSYTLLHKLQVPSMDMRPCYVYVSGCTSLGNLHVVCNSVHSCTSTKYIRGRGW